MKSIKFIALTVMSVMMFCACGGSQPVAQQQSVAPMKVKITKDECQILAEQKPGIRAWGEGTSYNLSSASNYAELQARSKFARAVAAKIKTAEEHSGFQYASTANAKKGMVRDEGSNNNEYQISVAEGVVKNAVIIKSSEYMMQDGSYQVFVCLEYNADVAKMADEIVEKVKQNVPDEERIKMQYEFQKFRERIEQELKSNQ